MKKTKEPFMAAFIVRATAPVLLDAMLYGDTTKLFILLSMYV